MKKLALLTVLTLIPGSIVFAAAAADDEINAELDRMYSSRSVKNLPSVQVNVTASPSQTQKNDQKTEAVQKQPVTVIESAPLSEARSESLRRARQEEEMKTEVLLVEKLEAARMEDERRRSEQLFGNKFNLNVNGPSQVTVQTNNIDQTANNNSGVVTQSAVIAAPVVAAGSTAVVPVVVAAPATTAVVAVGTASTAAVVIQETAIIQTNSAQLSEVKKEEERKSRAYIAGAVGLGEYPNAKNVRGNYSVGLNIGSKIDDRILVQGEFAMANYDVQQFDSGPYGYDPLYPRITTMNQYSFSGAMKYQILGGNFRPLIGGVLGYTYRTFSDTQLGFSNNDASSHAIDAGLILGADLEVSKQLTLGLDFRYMSNLYNRSQNRGLQTRFGENVVGGGTPIEKINYAVTSILARFNF